MGAAFLCNASWADPLKMSSEFVTKRATEAKTAIFLIDPHGQWSEASGGQCLGQRDYLANSWVNDVVIRWADLQDEV